MMGGFSPACKSCSQVVSKPFFKDHTDKVGNGIPLLEKLSGFFCVCVAIKWSPFKTRKKLVLKDTVTM